MQVKTSHPSADNIIKNLYFHIHQQEGNHLAKKAKIDPSVLRFEVTRDFRTKKLLLIVSKNKEHPTNLGKGKVKKYIFGAQATKLELRLNRDTSLQPVNLAPTDSSHIWELTLPSNLITDLSQIDMSRASVDEDEEEDEVKSKGPSRTNYDSILGESRKHRGRGSNIEYNLHRPDIQAFDEEDQEKFEKMLKYYTRAEKIKKKLNEKYDGPKLIFGQFGKKNCKLYLLDRQKVSIGKKHGWSRSSRRRAKGRPATVGSL